MAVCIFIAFFGVAPGEVTEYQKDETVVRLVVNGMALVTKLSDILKATVPAPCSNVFY